MTAADQQQRVGDFLEHILEALRLIREYCEGLDRERFLADRKTQQAVVLNLLIIGEAATKICNEAPDFASSHPAIPWTQMRGMRNRLVHGYFDIDLNIVWDTVREALPDVESSVRAAIGR